LSIQALIAEPFELLLELERRAKVAIAAQEGLDPAKEGWIGIAFRLGAEQFVAARTDVREVLPVPEHVTRVPGAKPWLRGISNVRGQLLTIVDLKAFLGTGRTQIDRHSRVLHLAGRELPSAVIVNEVLGFRRFAADDHTAESPTTVIRCDRYLAGGYRRGGESWPLFNLASLVEDQQFQDAGEKGSA
jgi:twitching motility protein PilI